MSDALLPRDLYDLAARVISANAGVGRTIAVAESCTGGLVGFITYSNAAKQEALGVPADLIDTFGAVSVAVAWAMARGALKHSHADVAVAITGVAGPEGGSEQKPVGTVVFAVARRDDAPDAANAEMKLFPPDAGRAGIRHQAALVALELLLP
jgi:nicotinamide-nucleotide amidase